MAQDVKKLEMDDRKFRVIRFVDGYRIAKNGWWVTMPTEEAVKMAKFIFDCEGEYENFDN